MLSATGEETIKDKKNDLGFTARQDYFTYFEMSQS